jgi:ankyrin repeat protein
MRTIFGQGDLERVSQAQGKVMDMYESMRTGPDSGFGSMATNSSLGEEVPAPPKLLGATRNPEQTDSGLGEDVETDHVAVETRTSALDQVEMAPSEVSVEPPRKTSGISVALRAEKPLPRRPRKTISPGLGTNMQYSSPRQATSDAGADSGLGTLTSVHVPAQQAQEEVQRLHLQNQWERILLQQRLHYLLPNKEGDTGFHLAVIHSRPDILIQLLALVSTDARLRVALDEQNSLYQTALHIATHTQQVEMIQKLLAGGASLELTDHKGNTPLHIACRFSSTKCLEELVRGVPLDRLFEAACIRNHQGQTCIHVATERGNTDALRKLKSIGIDMNVEDFHSGKTPLHQAVEKCSLTDVQFLTETCQVDVNKATYSGCTALHTAAGRGNIAVVAYLLSMGADPDLLTDEGDTALDLAGSDQVATILTKAATLRWLSA